MVKYISKKQNLLKSLKMRNKKKQSNSIFEYNLRNVLIFFAIILIISEIYWELKERLSNEEIIKYATKSIYKLKVKYVHHTISFGIPKIDIHKEKFNLNTCTQAYDICEFSDSSLLFEMSDTIPRGLNLYIYKNKYIIYYLSSEHSTRKGKRFGVMFSWNSEEKLVINQDDFPDFKIIKDKQVPKEKEKWIYYIDDYWAIYVP